MVLAAAVLILALRDLDLPIRLWVVAVAVPAVTLGVGVLRAAHGALVLGAVLVVGVVGAPLTTGPVDATRAALWAVALGLLAELAARGAEAPPPPRVGRRWGPSSGPVVVAVAVPLIVAPLLALVGEVEADHTAWVVTTLALVALAVRLLARALERRAAHPSGRHAHGDA